MEKAAKRGPNFTATESTLLTHLAKKYVSLIENKKTDSVTWREKKRCWEKIASEFNCASIGIPRSADTLRKKWDNIKSTIKEKMAGQRKYALGTGGGPSLPSPKLNDDEKDIFEIIQLQVTGTKPYFDSDQDKDNSQADVESQVDSKTDSEVAMKDKTNFITAEVPEIENGALSITIPEMSPFLPGCSSWSTYSPSLLRTPRAPLLEKNRTGKSNVPPIIDQEVEVEKENPLRRYRKRPHTGAVTNKAWCDLADYKKLVAKTKIEKLKKDMELTDVLIEQNKLKNKLLQIQIEQETSNKQ